MAQVQIQDLQVKSTQGIQTQKQDVEQGQKTIALLTALNGPVKSTKEAMTLKNEAMKLQKPKNKKTFAYPVFPAGMNPDVKKNLLAWMEAMAEIKQIFAEIKALIYKMKHGGIKNPMRAIQEVFGLLMQYQGAQVKALAAVDNVETDLRNSLQQAQSGFNTAMGSKDPKAIKAAVAKMIKAIDQIEIFLKYEKSLPEKDQILDKGSMKTLEDALKSIKTNLGGKWDVNDVTAKIEWYQSEKGTYEKGVNNIQNGFHTGNQTVSALSTTTNTRLQYKTEQFKQYMGIYESINQAYLKWNAAMVRGQKTS